MDAQVVIRQNRDTLYSAAIFDLDAGDVAITLPISAGRFTCPVQIINEDHYTVEVACAPAVVVTIARCRGHPLRAGRRAHLVDPNDAANLPAVHPAGRHR